MTDVYIKSGEQPRYFAFGGVTSTTIVAVSSAIYKESPYATFQAIVTGTGAVSATVSIQVTNEDATAAGVNGNWCTTTLGTITLTGTTAVSDGFTSIAPWRWVRVNVTAISGTGAAVQVLMGV